MSAFSDLLRYCLEANGQKTQSDLARDLGVSRSIVCDLLAERRRPSLETAQSLAFSLDADEASLLEAVLQDQMDDAGLRYTVTVRRTEGKR